MARLDTYLDDDQREHFERIRRGESVRRRTDLTSGSREPEVPKRTRAAVEPDPDAPACSACGRPMTPLARIVPGWKGPKAYRCERCSTYLSRR